MGGPPGSDASIKANAVAKLLSDGIGLVAGMAAAIVSARYLGPAGKGDFSVLIYVGGLTALLATLGWGDSAIYLASKSTYSFGTVARSGLVVTGLASLVSSALATGLLWILLLNDDAATVGPRALILFAVTIPIAAIGSLVLQLHHVAERFIFTSFTASSMGMISALLMWILLGPLQTGLTGAVFASLLTALFGLAVGIGGHIYWRSDLSGRIESSVLVYGTRFGAAVIGATTITSLAGRADLLVVHGVAGQADAGIYSVSLTLSSLPLYLAAALVQVGFPRLSRLTDETFDDLAARLVRMGLLGSTLVAIAVGALTPALLPLLFGPEFQPAFYPTLLLLVGSLGWSLQFILGRAAAAAGEPHVMLRSYVASLVLMLMLDSILVTTGGLMGAALASSIASFIGAALVIRWFYVRPSPRTSLQRLVPGVEDVIDLVRLPRDLLSQGETKRGPGR